MSNNCYNARLIRFTQSRSRASQPLPNSEAAAMFDPATNFSSLLGMLFGIVGTTVTAFFLPFVTLVLEPLQSIFQWFTQGA
jgi:hypothetical protein